MGIIDCNVECHYYNKNEEEQKTTNFYNTEDMNNKNNLTIFTKLNDLIPEKIMKYIKSNKLSYKSFIPSFSHKFLSNATQFPNKNIFFGNLNSSNNMEGYGIYILYSTKIITEGYWNNGILIYGRIFFPNNDIYEGYISKSLPDGIGKMTYSNGEIYKGEFKLGELTGKGIYIFNDNTYYCGDLKNGAFDGNGTMKWSNGIEYHGSFCNSKLFNKGKMYHDLLKEKYIGNFENNEFNGNGIYKYQNGDEYNGNFEYGKRRGKGSYKIENRFEYDGMWDHDLPNGEGVLIGKNFKIKARFKDGKFLNIIEVLEGENIDFDNIDLDIKARNRRIIPSSLLHLNSYNETEISEYSIVSKTKFI